MQTQQKNIGKVISISQNSLDAIRKLGLFGKITLFAISQA